MEVQVDRAPVAIVALTEASRHKLVETLEGPLETYRKVILIPDLQEAPSLWVIPRDLQGILGLEITKNLLNPFAHVLKRFMDLAIVLVTEMGVITPPVGVNVYVVHGIAQDVPLEKIFKGVAPFILALLACIIILLAFPQIVMFLPGLMR